MHANQGEIIHTAWRHFLGDLYFTFPGKSTCINILLELGDQLTHTHTLLLNTILIIVQCINIHVMKQDSHITLNPPSPDSAFDTFKLKMLTQGESFTKLLLLYHLQQLRPPQQKEGERKRHQIIIIMHSAPNSVQNKIYL